MNRLQKFLYHIAFIGLVIWEASKGVQGNLLLVSMFMLFVLHLYQTIDLRSIKKELTLLQERVEASTKIKETFYQLEGVSIPRKKRTGVPCGDCGKMLPLNMQCDNEACARVIYKKERLERARSLN